MYLIIIQLSNPINFFISAQNLFLKHKDKQKNKIKYEMANGFFVINKKLSVSIPLLFFFTFTP